MNYRIFFLLLLISWSGYSAKVFELDITIHENDSVDLINFQITEGDVSYFYSTDKDNYEVRILSDAGQILFNQSFEMHFFGNLFRGPNSTSPDTGPITRIDNYWKLPYFEDAALIQLFHEDKNIFEYQVAQEEQPPVGLPDYCPFLGMAGVIVVLLTAALVIIKRKKYSSGDSK